MNGVMFPRRVEPGWAGRWLRDSLALARRSPVSVAATLSGILSADLIYPQSLLSFGVMSLGFFLWTLALARILDCHCPAVDDRNVLESAWSAFREMLPGALRATAEAIVLMVGVVVFGVLVVWALRLPVLFAKTRAERVIPQVFSLRVRTFLDNSLLDVLPLNFPYLLIAFWMGALFGGGLLRHLLIGWYCCVINPLVLLLFIAAAWALDIATPGGLAAGKGVPVFVAVGFAVARVLVMFLLWLWVYFWIREMFEGRKSNAPRVAADRKTALVPAEA